MEQTQVVLEPSVTENVFRIAPVTSAELNLI